MIPIILDPNKPYAQLVNDNTNGLGRLNDTLDCKLTEVLNGIYEVEMLVPLSDKHFKDLALGSYVKLKAGEVEGDQIFKVYFISRPIDEKVVVRLAHLTYDLNKIPVSPFTATGSVPTKNQLLAHVIGSSPFDMVTDINNTTSFFSLDIPKSFRECLGGWEGSILDTFRCEYEWDNLTVKMLAHRGSDNGVRIAYGKNLTDFKQEENIQNVYTSVLGYAVVNEQTYVGEVYHKIVSNLPKVKIVDFSNDFSDTAPTTAQLTQKAQEYATNNDIEVPNVSINISFVPLYQTEEYKNIAPLERVGLGDTVHVYFEKLGVEATSRVVKRVWNVLTERYESIELGDTRTNLTTLLEDAVQEAKENITIDAGYIENELNDMSQLIINGLGLHRTLVPVSTGGHRMYLHNKPTLAESDTQYMIGAGGFMISTDYGQTWNSGWDADGNVVVNSLATITLKALEIYGSYLCFGDYPNGKYIEATTYSNSSSVQQGVSFDGTGTIRMQPQEAFYVNNLTSDGNNYFNRIIMDKNYSATAGNTIGLTNYDDTQNYIQANFIQMNAHYVNGANTYNRSILHNYATHTGTSVSANMIMMEARNGANYLYIRNRKQSVSSNANEILMSAIATQNNLYIRNLQTANTNYANHIQLNATATTSYIEMYNNKIGGTNKSNSIKIEYNSSYNNVLIYNYQQGYDYMGNEITLQTRSTYNNVFIENYKVGSDETVNELTMTSQSGGDTAIEISNGRISTGTTTYTSGNNVELSTTSSTNSIRIRNRDSSGSVSNEIYMNSSTNELQIYSKSDIHLDSDGAVRMTSSYSQDITLTSADDINIFATDKVYLAISGVQHQLSFGSDGNVKWS